MIDIVSTRVDRICGFLCASLMALAVPGVLAGCDQVDREDALQQLEQERLEPIPQAMVAAAARGQEDRVVLLAKAGVPVDARGLGGITPLIAASQAGQLDIVETLLDLGADVNVRDLRGRTALSHAIINGHEDVVDELLEAGADPNLRDDAGRTPFGHARRADNADIRKMVKAAGGIR